MKKINVKAIIIGTLVDIGGSLAFGIVMGIVMGVIYASQNGDMTDFEEYYYSSIPVMMTSLIIGLIFVSVGGYVAGKIAKQNEIYNAVGVGIVGILFGIFFSSGLPLWFNATSFALILPFAYIGGTLSSRANSKNEA